MAERDWTRRVCFPRLTVLVALLCALVALQSVASARSIDAIESDRSAAFVKVLLTTTQEKIFATPAKRKAGAAALVADINRVLALDQELLQAGGVSQQAVSNMFTAMHILKLALDDPSAKRLQERAIATGGSDAATAAMSAAAVEYLNAGPDEAAQLGALDNLEQALRSVKPNAPLGLMPQIFGDNPPVTEAVANRIVAFLDLGTDPQWRTEVEEWKSVARRMHLMNKPFAIEGTLVNGSNFSTAKWKGKVIYVDFWATWCAPCVAGLPDVAKLYTANHAKGLEVLNISADVDVAPIKTFLAKNKFLTWPQMFDFVHPGLKPMGPAYGINHLSATFIIDRKGILRYASLGSEGDPDELVTKLLAQEP